MIAQTLSRAALIMMPSPCIIFFQSILSNSVSACAAARQSTADQVEAAASKEREERARRGGLGLDVWALRRQAASRELMWRALLVRRQAVRTWARRAASGVNAPVLLKTPISVRGDGHCAGCR